MANFLRVLFGCEYSCHPLETKFPAVCGSERIEVAQRGENQSQGARISLSTRNGCQKLFMESDNCCIPITKLADLVEVAGKPHTHRRGQSRHEYPVVDIPERLP